MFHLTDIIILAIVAFLIVVIVSWHAIVYRRIRWMHFIILNLWNDYKKAEAESYRESLEQRSRQRR